MSKIFVINPERFYRDVVDALERQGVDVDLICGSEREGFEPSDHRAIYTTFAAMGGVVPSFVGDAVAPPDDLELLRPYEGQILLMLDRLNYQGAPVHRLHELYHRIVGVWADLLDRRRPDAVVFHSAPHMGFDFILYFQCRARGVATVVVDRTSLKERILLLSDIYDIPGPTEAEIAAARPGVEPASWQSDPGLQQMNQSFNDVDVLERSLSLAFIGKRFAVNTIRAGTSRELSSVDAVRQHQPLRAAHEARVVRESVRARAAYRHYCELARAPELDRPFVYAPLHFQPERSTLPGGGQFNDQLYEVELLSSSLPSGWRVLVKEHPRQFRREVLWSKARSPAFYDRLDDIPGVELVPVDVSSAPLIDAAAAVSTVTGTSGWEAVRLGKPALVFGYPWYLRAPGVFPLRTAEDVRLALSKLADDAAPVDQAAVRAYEQLMIERYTYRGAFSQRLLDLSTLTPEQNVDLYAEHLLSVLA